VEIKSDFQWASIVLAAGASVRMGQPKQLIELDGISLIQKTVTTSLEAGAFKTVVVTGANQLAVEAALKIIPVECVFNSKWEKGMGNSLKCGVSYLMSHFHAVNAVLILVCDQPFVNPSHLKKLVDEFQSTRSAIVASFYSGQNGVPVLFGRSMFKDLLAIEDQQGAKKIISQNPTLVKSVDFPQGEVDLDTPEDLKRFRMA
jgi:molybdenum cofactor cytidylyltransferase